MSVRKQLLRSLAGARVKPQHLLMPTTLSARTRRLIAFVSLALVYSTLQSETGISELVNRTRTSYSKSECPGPYLWDTATIAEGIGSNFKRREVSISLANAIGAQWLGVMPNSHDVHRTGGMFAHEGGAFLGLVPEACRYILDAGFKGLDLRNPETLLNKPEILCVDAASKELNLTGDTVYVFNGTAPNLTVQDKWRAHADAQLAYRKRFQDVLAKSSCPKRLSDTLTDQQKYRFMTNRRKRSNVKGKNEFRISIHFRWGDVGGRSRNAHLDDVRTYNFRTGNCTIERLVKLALNVQELFDLSDDTWRASRLKKESIGSNRTLFLFSEGNVEDFAVRAKKVAPDVRLRINQAWHDSFDEMSHSDAIITGQPSSFVRLAAAYCDQCILFLSCTHERGIFRV